MNRRRVMMLQQNKGLELAYDAASGMLPNNTQWLAYQAPYGLYSQTVVDNTLELTNNHVYQKNGFYPTEHEYATKCSMTVEFKGTPAAGVVIHLTDGAYSALGVIKSNSYFYVATNDVNHNKRCEKAVVLNDINTFTVIKYPTYAEYYLNGELLYTQTELFETEIVSIGNKGVPASDPTGNGFIPQRRNSIGTAYGKATTYIIKFIYKEW